MEKKKGLPEEFRMCLKEVMTSLITKDKGTEILSIYKVLLFFRMIL